MNVPFTDIDPVVAARNMCRSHRNKFLLEFPQLMAAEHIRQGSWDPVMKKGYASGNKYVRWARVSLEHYEWLWDCCAELLALYEADTGKPHGNTHDKLLALATPPEIPRLGLTPPPLTDSASPLSKALQWLDSILAHRLYMLERLHTIRLGGTVSDRMLQFTHRPDWA